MLRHAKSEQHADVPTDHDRPLNPRGLRDAPAIAARLSHMGWAPDAVLSSDATRTRQTWEQMRASLGGAPSVSWSRQLYLAGPSEVAAAVAAVDEAVVTAMVIGHNPGWEAVIHGLCGVQVRMTTCNAALLTTDATSWAEAMARDDWTLSAVVRPKEL